MAVIAWGPEPYVFTITRSTANAFRLTVIYATGDDKVPTWSTTVDDGTGPVTADISALASPNIVYLSFDISEGIDPIMVSIEADIVDGWITGFAFDSSGPQPASNPDPFDEKTSVLPNALLNWTPSSDADSQKVYMGTVSGDLALIGTLAAAADSCEPLPYPMALEQLYFWRVDTVVGGETVTGSEWSFTTVAQGSCNLYFDSNIDMQDFILFVEQWLGGDCVNNSWCEGADFDYSNDVDLSDFAIFASQWQSAFPADIIFNFETGDLQDWRIVEGAFGMFVCDREYFHNYPTTPYNNEGTYFLI